MSKYDLTVEGDRGVASRTMTREVGVLRVRHPRNTTARLAATGDLVRVEITTTGHVSVYVADRFGGTAHPVNVWEGDLPLT